MTATLLAAIGTHPAGRAVLGLALATAKTTALLVAIFLVLRLARRASAAARHLLLSLGFAALLVLHTTSWLLPPIPVPVLPDPAGHGAAGEITEAESGRPGWPIPMPAAAPRAPAGGGALRGEAAEGAHEEPAHALLLLSRAVLALYALGSGILLLILGLNLVRLRRTAGRGTSPQPESPTGRLVAATLGELGLTGRGRVVVSGAVGVPMACGLVRPRVLLPAGHLSWPSPVLRSVLRHELAHVRRGDAVTHLLAEVVCALQWFNPLVWAAARRLRCDSEHAADDEVLATGARASEYASHLLEVIHRTRPAFTLSAAPAMAAASTLEARIDALFCEGVRRGGLRTTTRRRCFVPTLAVALPLAALLPVGQGRPQAATGTAATAGISTVPGTLPGAAPASLRSWGPEQARWTDGETTAGLFLEGEVELARLAVGAGAVGRQGFLLFLDDGGAGLGGYLELAGRSATRALIDRGQGFGAVTAADRAHVWRRVAAAAPAWRPAPTSILGTVQELVGIRPAASRRWSGSMISGLPGSSRDSRLDLLQAGWRSGETRIGVFARGPVALTADGRGLAALPAGGWFAAFSRPQDHGPLRLLLAQGDHGGGLAYRYSEDGEPRPFGKEAQEWLSTVLEALPGRRPGARAVSWAGS